MWPPPPLPTPPPIRPGTAQAGEGGEGAVAKGREEAKQSRVILSRTVVLKVSMLSSSDRRVLMKLKMRQECEIQFVDSETRIAF